MNSRVRDVQDVKNLFEFWAEIRPEPHESKTSGHVVSSFPESFKEQKVLNDITEFTFPCPFEKRTVQIYSFVLTNIDAKWRFGFCRHDPKTDVAMVLITYLPWHDIFIRFLNVLADIKKASVTEFQAFLTDAYNRGVPEMGSCLKLFYDKGGNSFLVQRPSQFQLPSIPENNNLNLYYNFVEPKFMIAVFAAMLAERRIIFTSRRLDVLSSCIQAANAFLYPMVWQHIFIPVLPIKMKDILGAPMPFLIGVPESVLETVRSDEVGDVVILNCDNRTFESPFDDVKDLPQELVHSLKKQLSNSTEHRGDRVSRIFLGILVQLIGGYRDAVKFQNRITFDPETFIESRPSHLRPFLTQMLELQIFRQFIDERLDMLNTGQGISDEFEFESCRQAEKSNRKGKKYKNLIKNVRTKTNPAVLSAVESVKEGGRGMKTAYEGLKSRFRESSASSSSNKYDHGVTSFATNNGHHSSAPSSPVNPRRAETMFIPESSYIRPTKPLQSSMSAVNRTFALQHKNHNNNNIIKHQEVSHSPAGSPASSSSNSASNSSSDMNILQELQQQNVLFTSPAIDRSLKPSLSSSLSGTMEMPHKVSSRIGSPNHMLLPKTNQDFLTGALCTTTATAQIPSPQKLINLNSNLKTSLKNSFGSLFDTSPEMPSPPVPPRIKTASNNASINNSHSINAPSNPLSSSFSSLAIYKNNTSIHNSNSNNLMINSLMKMPNLNSQTSSSSSSPPLTAQPNSQVSLPTSNKIPTSPQKMSDDLINLDVNNSFEIEDFDPLNDKAKPIPQKPAPNLRSTTLPATVAGFNNPVYPYFTPTRMTHNTSMAGDISTSTTAANHDDNELLRTYGLDHFTISNSSKMPNGGRTPNGFTTIDTTNSTNNSRTSSKNQNATNNAVTNWTTFD